MSLNLLEKTELWVTNITLQQANLTEMAKTVARVLGLNEEKVNVVDVREKHITFDVLEHEVKQEKIMGKEKELLDSLAAIPGVHLSEDTYIHSNGILGLICASSEHKEKIIKKVNNMRSEIIKNISKRAIVFPSGFELERGLIKDTNTPYIKKMLEDKGFKVTIGDVIPDDEVIMSEVLSDSLSQGYGLIVTSGGVGAEDKDHSVESILNVDEDAATPYVVKYEQGMGRHVKNGVRIGVGQVGLSYLVSLPGPHDEVKLTMPLLIAALQAGKDKKAIAEIIAEALGKKLKKTNHSKKYHHHINERGENK